MPKKPARKGPRTLESRVYAKRGRFYLDARDLGAGQEALKPKGATRATDSQAVALELAALRVAELMAAREEEERVAVERSRADAQARILGFDPTATLGAYADRHLDLMAESCRYSESWLDSTRRNLTHAVVFFDVAQRELPNWGKRGIPEGPRLLSTISTQDVADFLRWLEGQPNGRGGVLGPQSRLHAVSALSKLFRRAVSEGRCTRNVVADLLERPRPPKSSTPLYEAEEMALLLESARLYQERNFDDYGTAASCVFDLLATLAYTGGRWSEVLSLDVEDVRRDVRDGFVMLESSKTERYGALPRIVPLSPLAVEILSAYMRRIGRLSGPLFATVEPDGAVRRLGDVRKTLARVAEQIGRDADYIRGKPLRVSWTTHYSTVDGISIHDVRDAGGWANLKQLAQVYGRARKRKERMGEFLDFSVQRWGHYIESELEALYSLPDGPDGGGERSPDLRSEEARRARLQATEARAEARAQVVRSFLSAIAGLSDYQAWQRTGVDRAAIRRARAAQDVSKVHAATVDRMEHALARLAPDSVRRTA